MLSVVLPTLNAAATLPACLAALREADEVVVADGGSADGTKALAGANGARVIDVLRGRGLQLRAGAAASRGNWLLFLHADTILGAGWRGAADAHAAAAPDEAACFRFRLDDAGWQARLIERGVAARRFPYGDQGLLVSRALYDALGGYRPLPLMEDVDLVRRIGTWRLRLLDVAATTSAERWRRNGWLRRSARNLGLVALYRLGASPERLAKLYG
ncbi:MAG TPA: TIGR04283 family arsenosugar biosynthesis glycosyltransferase [Allosphingosinicella sp.]|nr:TIGR04283 family arsenosugar biosynthesis glycosyltransferase [Allosphingosinicella sp.]